MNFAVSISTYQLSEHRHRLFRQCLESLLSTDYNNHIFIIDDHGAYDLSEILSLYDKIILVRHTENKGISFTKNTGIKYILDYHYDGGFLIDDDVNFLDSNWYYQYITAHQHTGIEHFQTYNHLGNESIQIINNIELKKITRFSGAFMTFTRSLINRIGYFPILPEKYGVEHVIFSKKASKSNIHSVKPKDHTIFDLSNSNELIKIIEEDSSIQDSKKLAANNKYYYDMNWEKLIQHNQNI